MAKKSNEKKVKGAGNTLGGAAVGAIAAGALDKFMGTKTDASGKKVPKTEKDDGFLGKQQNRSLVAMGLGAALYWFAEDIGGKDMTSAIESAGGGMFAYGAYGVAREALADEQGESMIAGHPGGYYTPIQEISGYRPIQEIGYQPQRYYAAHQDDHHAEESAGMTLKRTM